MGPLMAVAALGLALLVPADSPDRSTTVQLAIRHSRFVPARVEVRAGVAVRFVVRNLDPIDHELIIGDDATHRHHEHGREGHHHGTVPGEVTVPAGATSATTYRFDHPGVVTFGCHLPGHWAYGMQGVVAVRDG